jgi:GT2 family glycosyltransferase
VERVAAVIPNLNGAGFIGDCIEAARRAGIETVVVVDDGSTDASPAEADAAGATVLRSTGRGFAGAVATGVASTDTPYVLVLNSDCFLDADAVMLLETALDRRPELALVGAGLRRVDGTPAKSHGVLLGLGDTVRALLTGRSGRGVARLDSGLQECEFVPLACVLARREAWDAVGGIDTGYVFYFEDYDLCWRVGRTGRRIAVCWDAGAVHVGGASSHATDERPWLRRYYAGLARYLRKRYPVTWVVFPAVWLPYACVQSLRRPRRAGDYLGAFRAVVLPSR